MSKRSKSKTRASAPRRVAIPDAPAAVADQLTRLARVESELAVQARKLASQHELLTIFQNAMQHVLAVLTTKANGAVAATAAAPKATPEGASNV